MNPSSSATAPTHPSSDGEHQAARCLLAATLLALAGGSLDSFLYVNHGHVFAGAMTGNAVLCGVSLLQGHDGSALRYAIPLLAFMLGILSAFAVERRLEHHAVLVGLLCEMAGLLVAATLPASFPDAVFAPAIAWLAAFQVATFRKVDAYSYNSTFITGDLRTALEGLHSALDPETRSEGLLQFRDLGLIFASFLLGAVSGAWLSPRFGNHTLLFPFTALGCVLIVVVRLWLKKQSSGSPT